MKKPLILLFLGCLLCSYGKAQETVVKGYEPYGKVDKEDLELKECDFEKDANAEILFDKGVFENGSFYRHVRIKIFNTAGIKNASIRLTYFSYEGFGNIDNFKGETINLEGDKIV